MHGECMEGRAEGSGSRAAREVEWQSNIALEQQIIRLTKRLVSVVDMCVCGCECRGPKTQ